MGGASFTSVFSMYLRMLGRSQYHVKKLAHRSHPAPWIRIQLLANRARQMGYNAGAAGLEDEWNQIASALGIVENYYGFYHPTFLPMFIDTSPNVQRQKAEVSLNSLPQYWIKPRKKGLTIVVKIG